MKQIFISLFLIFSAQSYFTVAQNPENRQLWKITARITHNTTYQRDTTSSFMAGTKKWEKEFHQSSRETSGGTVSAVVENQAENQAKDFLYHSDSGDPVSLTVTGNGSYTESSNGRETIDGTLISAEIRTDNVTGSAYPGASLYFEYSDDTKSFGVGMSIKAVGSYNGRIYSGGINSGEWKDYGGEYDDYGLHCSGGGDPSTDANCKMTKTGNGYQGSWKESESKVRHTSNGPARTTSETTVEITLMPYKEPDKPVLTLIGCSELGVGESSMVVASAKPDGGTFRFWAEPGSMFTVETDGSSANLTGASPEKGTLFVEYTSIEGKTAQTSQNASCVKIEKYSGGQPIPQIALYDIDGKKLPGIQNVPVDAQPANASELVRFEPADPGILSAVGVGNEVTLQGVRIGTTTLQAKTNCGSATGPAVEVEVVKCDDETIVALERMKKVALENLVQATERLQQAGGSEEFIKARDELVSSTQELLAKAALTIIASGKSPTKAIKIAAEIADKGAALSEMIASSNPEELKNNIGKTASGDSFEKIVETQFGEKVGELWGKSLSAAIGVTEVQQAAQKFGDIVGEIYRHENNMKDLMDSYDKAMKDYENYAKRRQFCKNESEKTQPKKKQKPEQPAKPKEPTPPEQPKSQTTEPPVQEPQTAEPATADEPATDDDVLVDPEPPAQPPKQVGLPYSPSDCGCNQSKELTSSSAGFSALGSGIKNLGDCVENFRSTSLTDYDSALQELSALTDSLSTSLKSDAGAFLVNAKASKPRLDGIVNRVKSYDFAGNAFLNKMEKCPETLKVGMEIFQSVETITIDSVKTNY